MQKKRTSYLDKELIVPAESEVFVDVGGFQGKSSLLFQELCVSAGRPAPQCVIFEPDGFNFTRLQKNLPRFIKKPVCFQMGLWRERGQISFRPGAFSMSRIESSGRGRINVDSLDHVLEGMPELPPVTYIKIDVEGADLDVLYGARETIAKYRPRIAVAIYHSDGHMIKIPEVIHEICPGYRLSIRHYSCAEGETILYCL
ncbi:MAG: FkbM family methyltransferase [Oscillospiraceae bacterium]|nr:FkbM family methyltransferase [Oscillospiraceae bacterium]